jgi:tripartite-type tricarboxylate transporter receptor subunit TctC
MITRRHLLAAAAAGAAATPPIAARAQPAAWRPNRSIRLVLGFAPGGVGDLTARLVAPKMSEMLGQTIVIDNRPSAGGIVAGEAVARAQPDGHTLLLLTTTNSTASALFKSVPYDVSRDFTPVGRLSLFDHVLLVPADGPHKTVGDLIAAARAKPGAINLGSISVGNAQHLGAELFRIMAGVDMTVVPYRSTPDLVNATATGDVQVASEILAPVLSQVQGGRVRALAMCSAERFPLLPDVPTVAESGLPDYVVGSWNGIAGPKGLPKPVVDRLNEALVAAANAPDVRSKLIELGVKPAPSAPGEFDAFIRSEGERWARVVETAKIPKQ